MRAYSKKMNVILIVYFVLLLFLSACNTNRVQGYISEINGETVPPPLPPSSQDDYGTEASAEKDFHAYGIIHTPVDLGGRTIRHITYLGFNLLYTLTEEPDPAWERYEWYKMMWNNTRRVKNSFNFEIEMLEVDWSEKSIIDALTTSVMAGAPIADIALLLQNNIIPAVLDDILIPLDSINVSNSDILGPQVFGRTEAEILGERWSIAYNLPVVGPTLGVNLDIINAIGAPHPLDLYHRGQWTWDVWLEIMRLATRDTTGDGNIDQFGISGLPALIIIHTISANDGEMVTYDFNWNMRHPNTVEAMEFVEIIFSEGLLQEVEYLFHWPAQVVFDEGRSAFFIADYQSLSWGNPNFEFVIVPFPYGPSNTSGNVGMIPAWSTGLVFPQGSPWNPAELLMVIEELWTWAGGETEIAQEIVVGPWRAVYPTEDDFQRALHAGRHLYRCKTGVVPYLHRAFDHFAKHFLNHDKTALQVIDAHHDAQQVILDEFFRR